MAEIASAYVSLIPSMRGAAGKIDKEISPGIAAAGKKSGLSFGKLFAAGAALGLGAKAFSFLGDSLEEGREANKVSALVANAIKATGGAANVTADQVDRLATSISKKTGIDDEQIATASSLILTFKNVANEGRGVNAIFDRTTKAAVDLSAAGFGSVDGAAKQLGKALNDPIKGMSALSRSGVTFTAGQQTQIKALVETGNLLKAQKIILGEVNSQVGGAAAATATASDKAAVAAGNLKEQIGVALIPVVDSLAGTFTNRIIPAVSGFITGMTSGTGAGGKFAATFSAVTTVLGKVATFINNNRTAVGTFVGIIGTVIVITKAWAIAQAALNFVMTANPIGIVVVAIAALAGGLVYAYKKSETFRKIVDGAFAGIKVTAIAVSSFLTTKVPAAFKVVTGAATSAYNWVKSNWPLILAILTGPFGVAALAIIKNWDSIKAGGVAVIDFIKSIPSKITAIFSGAGTLLYNAGTQLMSGLAAGIRNKINDAINEVQAGLAKIKGMLPGSPIKWGPLKNWNNGGAGKRLMDLVARGITDGGKGPLKAAEEAFGKIEGALEKSRDNLQGILDGLKSDFASLADSVSSAFVGDLFGVTATEAVPAAEGVAAVAGKTVGQNFIDNLLSKKANLQGLLTSFKTLTGWGLDPGFLSQLFASGNGALITELAGMGQAGAVSTAGLFGEVVDLGAQLGNAVAQNDPVASAIATTNTKLDEVTGQLKFLNANIDKKLGEAVKKGAREGTREGNDDRNKDAKQRGKAGR